MLFRSRPKLQFVALFTHACFDEVHVIRDLRRIVPGNDRRDKERNRNIRAGRRGVLASIEAANPAIRGFNARQNAANRRVRRGTSVCSRRRGVGSMRTNGGSSAEADCLSVRCQR